jgi:mannonate dehydratase
MIRISVWNGDLSDGYLRLVTQLGVDCLDFGSGDFFPGVREQGYPELGQVLAVRDRLRRFGLRINRVTLPDLTQAYFAGGPKADEELDHACRALEVFGKADVPIARQRFAGDVFPWMQHRFQAPHRGGYLGRAESTALSPERKPPPAVAELEQWWERFSAAYERLVPAAEDAGIRLALHPSDTPNPDTPFGGLAFLAAWLSVVVAMAKGG